MQQRTSSEYLSESLWAVPAQECHSRHNGKAHRHNCQPLLPSQAGPGSAIRGGAACVQAPWLHDTQAKDCTLKTCPSKCPWKVSSIGLVVVSPDALTVHHVLDRHPEYIKPYLHTKDIGFARVVFCHKASRTWPTHHHRISMQSYYGLALKRKIFNTPARSNFLALWKVSRAFLYKGCLWASACPFSTVSESVPFPYGVHLLGSQYPHSPKPSGTARLPLCRYDLAGGSSQNLQQSHDILMQMLLRDHPLGLQVSLP